MSTRQVVFNGNDYDFYYGGTLPSFGKKYGLLTPVIPLGYADYGKTRRFFFLWSCECGKTKAYPIKEVVSGKTKSCGCLSYSLNPSGWTKSRNPKLSSWRLLYSRCKNNAKHRRLEFSITFEQFVEVSSKNCFFCNKKPRAFNKWDENWAWEKAKHITEDERVSYQVFASGIDRIDSSLGYLPENIQACCKNCNRAKMDLSQSEFLDLVAAIYKHRVVCAGPWS